MGVLTGIRLAFLRVYSPPRTSCLAAQIPPAAPENVPFLFPPAHIRLDVELFREPALQCRQTPLLPECSRILLLVYSHQRRNVPQLN